MSRLTYTPGLDPVIAAIEDAYNTSYSDYHNGEWWGQEQYERVQLALRAASEEIQRLRGLAPTPASAPPRPGGA